MILISFIIIIKYFDIFIYFVILVDNASVVDHNIIVIVIEHTVVHTVVIAKPLNYITFIEIIVIVGLASLVLHCLNSIVF